MPIKSNKQLGLPKRSKEFTLPSAGHKYNGLIPEGKVRIQSFSFETEQTMVDESMSIQQRLDKLTSSVWQMPSGFALENLYQYDQLYIVMAAWDVSTGSEYKLDSKCPSCETKESNSFKLPHGLPIRNLTSPENMEITLPDSKDKVVIDFATLKKASKVSDVVKLYKNVLETGDVEYIASIASNIFSVNGGTPEDLEEAMSYVKSLDGPDVPALRKAISQKPGVDRNVPIVCVKCKTKYTQILELGAKFFLLQDD